MERSTCSDLLIRALKMMAADSRSQLRRDERAALICWLQDIPSNVLILLPDDVLPQLERHIEGKNPSLSNAAMPLLRRIEETPEVGPAFFSTDSPLEIDFWLAWHEEALDLIFPLTPQYPIKGGQYRLDFAYPPLSVGIELDGYTYHSDREAFTRDRQRQREIEALGWHIMRFSGDELRANIGRCIQEASFLLSAYQYRSQ